MAALHPQRGDRRLFACLDSSSTTHLGAGQGVVCWLGIDLGKRKCFLHLELSLHPVVSSDLKRTDIMVVGAP